MPFTTKAASVDEGNDRHTAQMRTSSSGMLNVIALQQIAHSEEFLSFVSL